MNRDKISLRLSPSGIGAIDVLAAQYDLSRTDVIRAAIGVALNNNGQLVTELRRLKAAL